jgi:hypothetical protein
MQQQLILSKQLIFSCSKTHPAKILRQQHLLTKQLIFSYSRIHPAQNTETITTYFLQVAAIQLLKNTPYSTVAAPTYTV